MTKRERREARDIRVAARAIFRLKRMENPLGRALARWALLRIRPASQFKVAAEVRRLERSV